MEKYTKMYADLAKYKISFEFQNFRCIVFARRMSGYFKSICCIFVDTELFGSKFVAFIIFRYHYPSKKILHALFDVFVCVYNHKLWSIRQFRSFFVHLSCGA